MKPDDRETLRRIAEFNRSLAAEATDSLEHGGGRLTATDVAMLGRTCCDFGMSLLEDADKRDAVDVDATYVGAIRRIPSGGDDR